MRTSDNYFTGLHSLDKYLSDNFGSEYTIRPLEKGPVIFCGFIRLEEDSTWKIADEMWTYYFNKDIDEVPTLKQVDLF